MSHQDWKVVELKQNPKKLTELEISRAVLKQDEQVVTIPRFNKDEVKKKQNLDAETESFRLPALSHSFKIALMQARTRKGLTQAQLASAIGETESVVKNYENGKAVASAAVITKLNRVLGVLLPKIEKPKRSLR